MRTETITSENSRDRTQAQGKGALRGPVPEGLKQQFRGMMNEGKAGNGQARETASKGESNMPTEALPKERREQQQAGTITSGPGAGPKKPPGQEDRGGKTMPGGKEPQEGKETLSGRPMGEKPGAKDSRVPGAVAESSRVGDAAGGVHFTGISANKGGDFAEADVPYSRAVMNPDGEPLSTMEGLERPAQKQWSAAELSAVLHPQVPVADPGVQVSAALAAPAQVPGRRNENLKDLLARHVTQMLATESAAKGDNGSQVMLRLQGEGLEGTDLTLTRTWSGWTLNASSDDPEVMERIRNSADDLMSRFSESRLGQIYIETAPRSQ